MKMTESPLHQYLRGQILHDLLQTFDNSNADGMSAAVECAEAVFVLTSWARSHFVGSVLSRCLRRAREMRQAVTRISATWRGFVRRRNSSFARIRSHFLDELAKPPLSLELSDTFSVSDVTLYAPEVIVDLYREHRKHYLHALMKCRGSSDAWDAFPPFSFVVPAEQLLDGCRQRQSVVLYSPRSSVTLFSSFQPDQHSSGETGGSSQDPPLVVSDYLLTANPTPVVFSHHDELWTNDVRVMEHRRRRTCALSEREGLLSSRSAFADASNSCPSGLRSPLLEESRDHPAGGGSSAAATALQADSEPSRSRSRSIDVENCLTIPVACLNVPATSSSEVAREGGELSINSGRADEDQTAQAAGPAATSLKAVPSVTAAGENASGEQLIDVTLPKAEPLHADKCQSSEYQPDQISRPSKDVGNEVVESSSSLSREAMKGYSKRHMQIRPFSKPLPPRSHSPPMFGDKKKDPGPADHTITNTSAEASAAPSPGRKADRTHEIFDMLGSVKTPAMKDILSSVDGATIIQGRIRALQKLLRGTRRQRSHAHSSSPNLSGSDDDGDDDGSGGVRTRPGSAMENSEFIAHHSPVPCSVPSRALTPSLVHHGAHQLSPSPAAMLVPPCMRRCLTPVERTSTPNVSFPEPRLCLPRYKTAAESLSPADVCRLRHERETAKVAASFERGSSVAFRIRMAVGSRYAHETQQSELRKKTFGRGSGGGGALMESLKNRVTRGHSIDLSLFPTAVGAELRLATPEELKFLREVQVKLGRT